MKRINFRLVAAALVPVVLLLSQNVRASSFKVTTDPHVTCSAIEIEGEIKTGDYEQFVTALEEATKLAPLHRLYLNSGGGNLGAALAITDVIRNRASDVETIVKSGQSCNSACIVLLTAGARRNVSADAKLLIHQAFDKNTGVRDAEITKKLGQYMALHGMPPDVMWTMGNLKSDEVLAITASNAKRLGFGSLNFYGSNDPPATPLCSWVGFALKVP